MLVKVQPESTIFRVSSNGKTADSESAYLGSNPSTRTKCVGGVTGSRSGLKIRRRESCGFESHPTHQALFSRAIKSACTNTREQSLNFSLQLVDTRIMFSSMALYLQ